MPGVALYFGVYSYCKQHLLKPVSDTPTGKTRMLRLPVLSRSGAVALSAAIGNSVASFSRVPYETMKQKLQAGVYRTTGEAFLDIFGMLSTSPPLDSFGARLHHGWNLLFPPGGVAVQMIRDVPYAVVTLLLYETLQHSISEYFASKNRIQGSAGAVTSTAKRATADFIAGGISGGVGSWVTTPMDVIVSHCSCTLLPVVAHKCRISFS
jgi:hypothetical protein